MLVWPFFRWLEEFPERRQYKGLPRGCWHCELLGICRKPKEEGWKCRNGCMVLNWENERKYEGLPRGCWNCKYLSECRRPKEEGWKCYNGCRKIKEREIQEARSKNKIQKKERTFKWDYLVKKKK